MSVSEKEVREESDRIRETGIALEKRVSDFLREKLLINQPYCTLEEIGEDLRSNGFSFKENWQRWLSARLENKSYEMFTFLKIVEHKNETYYRYKYNWLAKLILFLRK